MRILLQTTIPFAENDWHIGRFALLRAHLARTADVVARDREPGGDGSDPFLLALAESDFDQIWLFAVDAGNGITDDECIAITRFRERGGAVFVTRDHMDLGASICNLGGIGHAHFFHTKNIDPNTENHRDDDTVTSTIGWPNFHSGANGDVQTVDAVEPLHPVLQRTDGSRITRLPAHPHEGAVGKPADDPHARVIATGTSKISGRPFNIAVAFESGGSDGRGWAESTFHHFCDYNWDVSRGCPTFVSEEPSNAIANDPALLHDTKTYVTNLAQWLGARRLAKA